MTKGCSDEAFPLDYGGQPKVVSTRFRCIRKTNVANYY